MINRENWSYWSIDESITGSTTSDQSQPESNGNERVLHISWTSILEPGYQMQDIKWFQVLLSNTNNSIQHYSSIC